MKYIPPEIVKEIQKIDLLTYLKRFEPNELVYISGDTYCLKSHDSLKISNGLWNWFSKGVGGKNAIDFLMKVRGLSFMEAAEILTNKSIYVPLKSEQKEKQTTKEKKLQLPTKSSENTQIIKYLRNRGIDEEIIKECIEKGIIYQEKETNNVVFLGLDTNNNAKYASVRATNDSRFMRDCSGSDKGFSFRLLSNTDSKSLHVFESAIDLLSYATILKIKKKDYKKENLISLSGVYQPAKIIEESKIPITLENLLESNLKIEDIILHLDRDMAGRNATKALEIVLGNKYNIIDVPVPIGKDVNDFLCYKLGLKKIKNKENLR